MASKSAQEQALTSEDIEELLDAVDKNLERVKTLYEQYFLAIQKQPPTFIHTDIERKLRDLTQLQLRNTGLRYRLATLQQKFGAYNAYWKRTLRQIENGTYLRNLSKIGRDAIRTGAEIPEEILAAMPKRMREQVVRDREQAIALAKRRQGEAAVPPPAHTQPPEVDEVAAVISESSTLRRELKTQTGAYVLDEADAELDIDAFFDSVVRKTVPPPMGPISQGPIELPKPAPAPPAPAATTAAVPKPLAPSQITRPLPIMPGAAAAHGPVDVEETAAKGTTGSLPPVSRQIPKIPPIPRPPTGPVPTVPRPQTGPVPTVPKPAGTTQPVPKPVVPKPATTQVPKPAAAPAGARPPPGMTDADVNALYAKYVQAKQALGETVGPDGRGKLLKTISAQAPKIMEQYKAKGVEFTVAVKDNQVIIRAKPKT